MTRKLFPWCMCSQTLHTRSPKPFFIFTSLFYNKRACGRQLTTLVETMDREKILLDMCFSLPSCVCFLKNHDIAVAARYSKNITEKYQDLFICSTQYCNFSYSSQFFKMNNYNLDWFAKLQLHVNFFFRHSCNQSWCHK